ncbi:MAG: hypothetical protein CW716_02235 [Candidatus Bathyarchaeum sp.]|nr:MAG: hypothetical protein CW716_02235 [Candidatus Bathyarchaeum sp.]
MPFTPYHIGPGLFLGLVLLGLIDFPTFLVANVIVDVEPFLVLFFDLNYPLHGFFHSFLGGTLVAVLLALVMFKIRDKLTPVLAFFQIKQKVSFKRIIVASFSGIYLHILLDSPIYSDIQPFYPSAYNPFFSGGILAGLESYIFCIGSFLAAVAVYVVMLILRRKQKKI